MTIQDSPSEPRRRQRQQPHPPSSSPPPPQPSTSPSSFMARPTWDSFFHRHPPNPSTTPTTTTTTTQPPLPSSRNTHPFYPHHLPLLLLLVLVPTFLPLARATCRFPDFLQRDTPWAASYGLDARLVMYVTGTYMTVSQQTERGDTQYTRKCEKRAADDKFVVTHQEKGDKEQFLCIKFLQRSQNIVQMKTSRLSDRQSPDLCDERAMTVDRWPIVQMSQTPEQKIPCPFVGGFNVKMYYPNDTLLCTDSTLLMRIESECEQGEGIVFDFRQEECVPASLPRARRQQAYCIAHWTQDSQTFIILQHVDVHKQTWCLRITDPLSDIRSAHLILDLVCDTSQAIKETKNYFRLDLTRRVYASTCEDEIESDVCPDLLHLCKTNLKHHCARTCRTCRRETVGDCAFEETYRGLWVDSGHRLDTQLNVGAYSMHIQNLGRYDCLRLEGHAKHKDKRVLVRIDDNGCYPRYACAEMDKVSSSVMRFRLGDRLQWPLPQARDHKDHVCAKENFLTRNAIETRFHEQRPPRLLVKQSDINTVPCQLPKRLHGGVAFREEGQSCSGCLMYQPSMARDRFVVRPHNCSFDRPTASLSSSSSSSSSSSRQRLATIDYSCLASFVLDNSTHAIVTRTTTSYNQLGQYLCWLFTPDNHIKVLKAAETFVFNKEELLKPELLEAQFSISRRHSDHHCRNVLLNPSPSPTRGATTTTSGHSTTQAPPRDWLASSPGSGKGSGSTSRPAVTYLVPTGAPKGELPDPDRSVGGDGGEGEDGSAMFRTNGARGCEGGGLGALAVSVVVAVVMGEVFSVFVRSGLAR